MHHRHVFLTLPIHDEDGGGEDLGRCQEQVQITVFAMSSREGLILSVGERGQPARFLVVKPRSDSERDKMPLEGGEGPCRVLPRLDSAVRKRARYGQMPL
jgi:hypothetical protein